MSKKDIVKRAYDYLDEGFLKLCSGECSYDYFLGAVIAMLGIDLLDSEQAMYFVNACSVVGSK